ncbi:hypothetical protein [Haloferula sp. BvORR071]|uniref:hypothetical protein n=1 Tax=Haloferula sp. BvORR071 TaxID=1396141 RepID=UPI00054DB062|nr:hypothetical protein [Haloferula sp. BvORR071]
MDPRAKAILPQCRQLIGQADHRPAACDGKQLYPKQDHRWYAEQQQAFEDAGCHLLGDYHFVGSTPTASDQMRCFIRALLTPDGLAGIAVYHTKPPLWQKLLLLLFTGQWRLSKVRECQSFFSDGTSVTTTIVAPSSLLDTPPHESRLFVPPQTSVADQLEAHRRHVEDWCSRSAGRTPRRMESLEELYTAEFNLQRVTQGFRKKHGGMTVPEIARMANCSKADAEIIQADLIVALQAG